MCVCVCVLMNDDRLARLNHYKNPKLGASARSGDLCPGRLTVSGWRAEAAGWGLSLPPDHRVWGGGCFEGEW